MLTFKIPETDAGHIVSDLSRLIGADLKSGPFIAGGSVRQALSEEALSPESDIDVFFSSFEQVHPVRETMIKEGAHFANANDIETFIWRDRKVQLIGNQFHESIDHLFSTFDFTVCAFATDGVTIVCLPEAKRDLDEKMVRVIDGASWKPRAHSRLAKYCRKGFRPAPGVFRWCMNASNRRKFDLYAGDYQ